MTRPPRWTEALLTWLLPSEASEEIVGDLREEWRRGRQGPLRHLRHLAAVLSVALHFFIGQRTRLGWRQHLRVALRRLGREPSFSGVAVSAIALGIGVNVLMLAIAETVLFAPLPYPESDRLTILTNDHTGSSTGGFGVAYANIRDVREQAPSLEAVALYLDWQDVAYQAETGAIRIPAAFVSDEYVSSLGLRTAFGRFFTSDENRENAPAPVAVLGHGTWQSVFGGDPGVLGRSISLNGRPYEIIGVAGDDRGDLRYRWGQDPVGIYLPLFAAEPLVGFDLDADRGGRYLNGLVRLREGTDIRAARQELEAISRELAAEFPRTNEGWSYAIQSLDEAMYEGLRTPTAAVLGISVLVFALVTVNLLTLILLRASGRIEETAVRRVLGAGRSRIVAQLLTESTVLAGLGWIVGMGVAAWGLGLVQASDAVRLPEFATLALDMRVLLVSLCAAGLLAVVLAAAAAATLLRAVSRRRDDVLKGLRGSRGRRGVRIQGSLVVVEVALASLLLVGAGLFLESFRTLHGTGYGFETERLLLARIDARNEELGTEELLSFASTLESSAEGLDGVEDAFVWSPNRLGHGNQVDILTPEGRWEVAPEERLEASLHTLRPGTLESVGLRLVAGRGVEPGDGPDAPRVAWVSESLGQALWPGDSPLGRRMETVEGGERVSIEVVGVVSDARHRTRLIEPFAAQRDVYYPYAQNPGGLLSLALRYEEGAALTPLATAVREIVADLSPASPVHGVTTMAERMRLEEGPARLGALLVASYAVLAVGLAALGLYGVLAHDVQLQLREIGIRKALGARRGTLLARVLRRGMALTGVGLVVGLALAVPASGLVRGALYSEDAAAPWIYGAVLAALFLVALLSSALPAGRAVRVSPMDVLRTE